MPGLLPDSDSEDELPPGWEERANNNGHVFYMNHQTRSTQWRHPRTGKSKRVVGELPPGWRQHLDPDTGRTEFVDGNNEDRRTYTDPRLAFVVEELPGSIEEVRQRFDASTTALQVLHGRNLSGQVAIVTGANTGIGYETAKSLAIHGCTVVLACRRLEAGEAAVLRIAGEMAAAAGRCRVMVVDLAAMAAVREFVQAVRAEFKHIDMLILNAAVFALPHTRTGDNLETTFQVCHLAHHYIATRLSDRLHNQSRVVVVSSESHRFASLPHDPAALSEWLLSPPANRYSAMSAYNNAKLCNVLFARELGRLWQDRGIAAYSLHPGNMVSSDLSRNWWLYRWLFALVRPFTKSLQQAASTTVYCATAPELTAISGQYYNSCYFCAPSELAQNEQVGRALWQLSETMIERILGVSGGSGGSGGGGQQQLEHQQQTADLGEQPTV